MIVQRKPKSKKTVNTKKIEKIIKKVLTNTKNRDIISATNQTSQTKQGGNDYDINKKIERPFKRTMQSTAY